jgi:hypothetical protein
MKGYPTLVYGINKKAWPVLLIANNSKVHTEPYNGAILLRNLLNCKAALILYTSYTKASSRQ